MRHFIRGIRWLRALRLAAGAVVMPTNWLAISPNLERKGFPWFPERGLPELLASFACR